MAARDPALKTTPPATVRRVPLDGPSRPHRPRAEKDRLPASPSPRLLLSSLPTTGSSSRRPSTRPSPASAAMPRRRGSSPTAHPTCRKPRTSTTYPHSKPTTVCRPSQTCSQSPSEQHGISTTTAVLATPRTPTCSRPCPRPDSRPITRTRPQRQGRVNTSPPKRQLHHSLAAVRTSSHAWCTTVVISHPRRRRQCPTRLARQRTHRTPTCTAAAAHGDVDVTSTNTTTARPHSAASNPV
jgi:hypothetical protein